MWRGTTSQNEERKPLGSKRLCTLRDAAFAAIRERLALEHDELLNTELGRLHQWAEDEEAALKARQEDLRRRIADAKTKAEKTTGYVDRFRTAQQAAALEKERRRKEERLFMLNAEIRRKRDERIEVARHKSTLRFWDEEMFVLKFKVMDNT